MSAFSIATFCIILLCIIFIVIDFEKKRYFFLFGVFTHLCLFFLIDAHIGKDSGSPKLSDLENRRFEHYGYFIRANEGRAVFTQSPVESGFPIRNIGLKDSLVLTPDWNSNNSYKIDYWNLKSLVTTQPLRINDTCINVPETQWLDNNDSLEVALNYEKVTIRFMFSQDDSDSDTYFFQKYKLNDTNLSWIPVGKVVQVPFPKLKEGYALNNIVKKSEIGIVPELITKAIFLTREVQEVSKSRLGFLISNETFTTPGFSVFKNGQQIKNQEPIAIKVQSNETIKYGYGKSNIYGIQLSNESKLVDNVYWAFINLLYPNKWIIPEDKSAKVLITSSNGYTNFDYSYQINLGKPQHPFYAIANWDTDTFGSPQLDTVIVNKGDSKTKVGLDQPILLGNGIEGALLRFSPLKSSVNFVYWKAMVALAISFILLLAYLYLGFIGEFNKPAIEKLWLILWVVFLSILTMRLTIAYRIDLLPPENATLGDLSIFSKALNIISTGIYSIPIVFFLLRLILSERVKRLFTSIKKKLPQILILSEKVKRVFNWIKNKLLHPIFWGILATLIPILGHDRLFGENQALFGDMIRVNIFSLISLFIFLFFFSKKLNERVNEFSWRYIIFYYAIVLLVTGLNVMSVGDTGFIIYLPIFLFAPALWTFWDRYSETATLIKKDWWFKLKQYSFWIPIGFMIIAGIILLSIDLPFITKLKIGNNDGHIYRLLTYKDLGDQFIEEPVMADIDFSIVKYKRNTFQYWQMLNYASNGELHGKGYGRAPLTNAGITYPTSLNDCFFSIYILSEFGLFGGLSMLSLYAIIFICCLLIGLKIPKEIRNRTWLFYAFGGFWFFTTLYMVSANIGLLPFTGQNIPLLSLNSNSDFSQQLIFIILLGFLAHSGVNGQSQVTSWTDYNRIPFRNGRIITLFIVIWTGAVIYALVQLGKDEKLKSDHRLSESTVEKIEGNLDKITVEGKEESGVKLGIIEKYFLQQYKDRTGESKKDPQDGLFYSFGNKIKLNKNYLNISSPFSSKGKVWEGKLYASRKDEYVPIVSCLNHSIKLGLGESEHPKAVYLNNIQEYDCNYRDILLTERRGTGTICQISRSDSSRIIISAYKNDEGNEVFINGDLFHYDESAKVINIDDIILLKTQEVNYYLVYRGYEPDILAFTSWKNGKIQRNYPEGEIFPMAYTISKSADYVNLQKEKNIFLTINIEHQRKIQQEIKKYAKRYLPYMLNSKNEIHNSKQISFCLMDPYSGEILALGSWPNFDPNNPEFEKYLNNLPSIFQERILRNPNLRNHHIGSTFKPFAYAALATNMPDNLDISNLEIYHPESSIVEREANDNLNQRNKKGHPHLFVGGLNFDNEGMFRQVWDCKDNSVNQWISSSSYLAFSRNYYQLGLFTLGLADFDESFNKILASNNEDDRRTEIRIGNSIRGYLDLRKSRNFQTEEFPDSRPKDLTNSRIFIGLDSLFTLELMRNKSLDSNYTLEYEWRKNLDNYLPSFEGNIPKDKNKANYLKFILPEPIIFRANGFSKIDEIETFARGGGERNRWNNIVITESFSRLITGRYVNASLEKRDSIDSLAMLPYPFDDATWRNRFFIDYLERAVRNGTSRRLNREVTLPANYKLIAKTGTIPEKDNARDSEMLMFSLGEWNNNNFVSGKSFSCFLYLEEAPNNHVEDENTDKFDLTIPIVKYLKHYLTEQRDVDNERSSNTTDTINYVPSTVTPYLTNRDRDLSTAIDYRNPITRNYAVRLAGKHQGEFNVNQVCAIFNDVYSNWNYVSDPDSGEYFAKASESISNGLNGDCDDFAVVLAATVKAIGGNTHIALAFKSSEKTGHAYAELLLPSEWGSKDKVKRDIIKNYPNNNLTPKDVNIRKDDKGLLWLNLDYWKGHIGGPYYESDPPRYVN